MSTNGSDPEFEARLVRVVLSSNPVRALHAAARDPRLAPATRAAFRRAHPDSIRLTAFLLRRLRLGALVVATHARFNRGRGKCPRSVEGFPGRGLADGAG
jgi:hypothetical protein